AERQHREAEVQREAAVVAEKHAVAEAAQRRRLLYVGSIQLASQMWQDDTTGARRIDGILSAWDGTGPEGDRRQVAWRYPWGLIHDGPGILHGHDGGVRYGAWRPDGSLVTIDAKRVLRLWDVEGAKMLAQTDLAEEGAIGSSLSADGNTVGVLTRD